MHPDELRNDTANSARLRHAAEGRPLQDAPNEARYEVGREIDFRALVENRIKQLWVEQRELQDIIDGLPNKLPPGLNQALINQFFRQH